MKQLFYTTTLIIFFVSSAIIANAQGGVAVNSVGAAPDSSALFDISSINKGILIPRMSTTQRNTIAKPATGLTIFNTDCGVFNFNAGTTASPNWVTINSSNALIAGVSISANPAGAICSGASVTFTATPNGGINSPNYQWKVNGQNVGTNSSTYTSTGLNNGDVVTCILSSSEACITGSPATSNSISMTVNPIPATPGSITGSTNVCANSTGNIYSISPVSGATTYNWTVPADASIASGAGNTSITVSFGSDSGNISVTAVNSCGSSASSSQAITVSGSPATPGTISGNQNACINSSGNVYSVSSVSGATTYTWSVPGDATITAGGGTNSITVTFGSTSANISVTAGNTCGASSASTLLITLNGASGNQTFNYTGSMQTFTVPNCASSITITAYGAQGGNSGGLGGRAQGTLNITPGSLLYVFVGGQSNFNGGGAGAGGSNGGDMSDVRQGSTSFSNAIIVAGGGGGSFPSNGIGGTGGGGDACVNGAGGGAGQAYVYQNTNYSGPGYAGTCGAGGAGGNGYGGFAGGGGGGGLTGGGAGGSAGGYGNNGSVGSAGQGGSYGPNGACSGSNAGGGGGGGYYGGGGGANGQCQAGGGGGGSSWASNAMTNVSFSAGVQSGTGQIVFTW